MDSHGLFDYYNLPNFISSLWKVSFFPCHEGDLHIPHNGCRPWIAILCWSQINSSLLKKYVADYLFQVNTIYPHSITFHRLRVQCYKTVPYFLPPLLQGQSQAQVVAFAYYWLAYKSETSRPLPWILLPCYSSYRIQRIILLLVYQFIMKWYNSQLGFPGDACGKKPACQCRRLREMCSIPG